MERIYKKLMEHISSNVPALKWVDWDYGQIDFFENNYPVPFPACMIDFADIKWNSQGRYGQDGEVTLQLRIAFNIYEDYNNHTPEDVRNSALDKLALLKTIHRQVQGYAGDEDDPFNALMRVRTFPEKRRDALKVFVMHYVCDMTDASAMPEMTTTETPDMDEDISFE